MKALLSVFTLSQRHSGDRDAWTLIVKRVHYITVVIPISARAHAGYDTSDWLA